MADGTEENFREQLMAFADGELDDAQIARLLASLADRPAAAAAIRDYQRLNSTARRVVSQSPPAPQALRDRISQAISNPNFEIQTKTRLGWPAIAAALALLIAGGLIARFALPDRGIPTRSQTQTATNIDVIPASIVAHARFVHADCSRLEDALHDASFPKDRGTLAAAVQRDLHSDHPYPDFSSIGFKYVGAGPCGNPLPNTIHLLYRSKKFGSRASISLFVQENHGQYSLKAGQIYSFDVAQSPFPMLAWRTDEVIYFLLADNQEVERAALDLIRDRGAAPTTNR